MKINVLCHNKLCFVSLLYMGVLQCDPMPKLCFVMVLIICKDFLQIVRKEELFLFNDTLNTFIYGYMASDIW